MSLVFQIVVRSHHKSLYLKMLGKGLLLKATTLLVFFLWLEKSWNFEHNRIFDHLEKCNLFFYLQYSFISSQSTADLLTVVYDRIIRAFNRSGPPRAITLNILKAFNRVWHAGLHKLKSWNFRREIWLYFILSHYYRASGCSGWEVFTRISS